MKRIVMTGGTELIGFEVIKILKASYSIFAVCRRPDKEISDSTRLILSDLSHGCNFSQLPENVDAVIHLAQSEHYREFPDQAEDIFSVNTMTTLKLLDYARRAGARTFIYASSGGVYGLGDEGFYENHPVMVGRELGFYLGSKVCSEIIAENYAPYMNIILLRFFFCVWSPGRMK